MFFPADKYANCKTAANITIFDDPVPLYITMLKLGYKKVRGQSEAITVISDQKL